MWDGFDSAHGKTGQDLCTHYTRLHPITVFEHETDVLSARIDAMTDRQRKSVLMRLQWTAPDQFEAAMTGATR